MSSIKHILEYELTTLTDKPQRTRLHLPDCPSLHPVPKPCDCGKPNHPLPPTREFYHDRQGRIRTRKARAKNAGA